MFLWSVGEKTVGQLKVAILKWDTDIWIAYEAVAKLSISVKYKKKGTHCDNFTKLITTVLYINKTSNKTVDYR